MKQIYLPSRTAVQNALKHRVSGPILCIVFVAISLLNTVVVHAQGEPFSKRVVASGFNNAWEVLYGPNDSLWVTENKGYLIQRVSVATGAKTQLLDLRATDASINFLASVANPPQGGLMGIVIHPDLFSTDPVVRAAKPWVYVAYVYNRGSCPGNSTVCIYTTKIVRYDYSGNSLINPVTIINTIPGSSDHNSGRLVISPIIEPGVDAAHTQYRLYYTVGDMGAGQFQNQTRAENAQNVDIMEGKVLRMNSESDGDAGQDAWIPNDNPFFDNTAITPKDYVYTLGHRNAQGLAWGKIGSAVSTYYLYSTEQMDKSDDEVNLITAGRNYGWDQVSGYCDGNQNGFKIGQNTNPNEQAFCSVPANNHTDPIFTLSTATAAQVASMPASNALWPTAALSSIAFYPYTKIAGWRESLLVTGLKRDRIYRMKLNASGTGITGDSIPYFAGDGNRIRRITVNTKGTKFYVARDVGATLNGGTIMEYTFTGVLLALKDRQLLTPTAEPDEIEIFPNPVADILTINGKKNIQKPLHVQFYDMSGILLKEESSSKNTFSVNIGAFKPGMYVVKLLNGFNVEIKTEKVYKH